MSGKTGTQGRAQSIFWGTALYNTADMQRLISQGRFSESQIAQFRLEVIQFHDKYGTKITVDAYKIGKATIYRWKGRFKGRLCELNPLPRTPKRKRVMQTNLKVVAYIKGLREDHYRLGKEKIKPLLDEYCKESNLPTIAVSTIGKVIKRHKLVSPPRRIYHNPNHHHQAKIYKTRVKKIPKPRASGYLQIDTIVKFIHGIKVYIFNGVDIKHKFQFSYGYTKLNSLNAKDFFQKLELVYPIPPGIITVHTDNGLEFHGEFLSYLKKQHIKHVFSYPRCPKINGFVERANRTLQEEFITIHIQDILDGLNVFNNNLIDYLIWYNTKRVHKSLGNITPIDPILLHYPKSHMYVTHTNICIYSDLLVKYDLKLTLFYAKRQ